MQTLTEVKNERATKTKTRKVTYTLMELKK